eukprot:919372-Rhodomonas_salina.3
MTTLNEVTRMTTLNDSVDPALFQAEAKRIALAWEEERTRAKGRDTALADREAGLQSRVEELQTPPMINMMTVVSRGSEVMSSCVGFDRACMNLIDARPDRPSNGDLQLSHRASGGSKEDRVGVGGGEDAGEGTRHGVCGQVSHHRTLRQLAPLCAIDVDIILVTC